MWIVDRIEKTAHGVLVVCEKEDGDMENVALEQFLQEPNEGDCVQWQDGRLVFLAEETQRRRQAIREKFNALLNR